MLLKKIRIKISHISGRGHILHLSKYSKGCKALEEIFNYLVESTISDFDVIITLSEDKIPKLLVKILENIEKCENQEDRRQEEEIWRKRCIICVEECNNKVITTILAKLSEEEYAIITIFPSPDKKCNIYV